MDTKEVNARFEQERQALALVDHPNIARVLDAGATAIGRPFALMPQGRRMLALGSLGLAFPCRAENGALRAAIFNAWKC